MRRNTFRALCMLLFVTSSLFAQNTTSSDDVYYDATSDGQFSLDGGKVKKNKDYAENEQQQGYTENGLEEDDYYYSKRVRRFNNSNNSMRSGYYDPRFTDLYNYDPYYANSAFSFGRDYYRWNMMQMNRWNSYAMMDWYNPYCSPFSRYGYTGMNYYFPAYGMGYGNMGMGFGMNSYHPYGNGYHQNYYNNSTSNNNSGNSIENPKGTTFRPRTDGTVKSAPRNSGRGWNEGTTTDGVRTNPNTTSGATYSSPRNTQRHETATQERNVWGGNTGKTTETPRRSSSRNTEQQSTRQTQSYETPSQSAPSYNSSPRSSGDSYKSGSSSSGSTSSPRGRH
jgi:hypothetical protein